MRKAAKLPAPMAKPEGQGGQAFLQPAEAAAVVRTAGSILAFPQIPTFRVAWPKAAEAATAALAAISRQSPARAAVAGPEDTARS
jgi:hypothetical protein